MAKDTRVKFDSESTAHNPSKSQASSKMRRPAERQISYEETDNCVNEINEQLPALHSMNRAHRIMRQVSNSFSSRTIKVALILSVILNLLISIPFGIFIGIWMSSSSSNELGYSDSSSKYVTSFKPTQYPGKDSNHHRANQDYDTRNNNNINNRGDWNHNSNSKPSYNNNNNNNNNFNDNSPPWKNHNSHHKSNSGSSSSGSSIANNFNNINLPALQDMLRGVTLCIPCDPPREQHRIRNRRKRLVNSHNNPFSNNNYNNNNNNNKNGDNTCCCKQGSQTYFPLLYVLLTPENRKMFSRLPNAQSAMECEEDGTQKCNTMAHLSLNLAKSTQTIGQNKSSLSWFPKLANNKAFVRNNVYYEEDLDLLRVDEDGWYHVYNHISLIGKWNYAQHSRDGLTVHHQISVIKNGHKATPMSENAKTLLATVITLTRNKNSESNLVGIVQLQKGDRIFVSLSFLSVLFEEKEGVTGDDRYAGNVFGLFRL